jgi:hypothetical protein
MQVLMYLVTYLLHTFINSGTEVLNSLFLFWYKSINWCGIFVIYPPVVFYYGRNIDLL